MFHFVFKVKMQARQEENESTMKYIIFLNTTMLLVFINYSYSSNGTAKDECLDKNNSLLIFSTI